MFIISNFYQFQYDLIGDILASDAEKIGKNDFPLLKPIKAVPRSMPLPFNYVPIHKIDEVSGWYHCFIDDDRFERLWNNFDHYIPYIKKMDGIISTDFSLYRNLPSDVQIRNCYRNRVMAHAMRKVNPNVIPTAGFGGEDTWEWCFDGLPINSTVAITTNGTLSDPEARRLFIGGVDELVRKLSPYAIIVCGNYPGWLDTKYPHVKIIPIHSFSQMRRFRRCG